MSPLCRYSCDKCGKKFFTKNGLNIHIKKQHDEEFKAADDAKVKICDLCGKTILERNYNYHYKWFHGNESLKCSECDQVFTAKLKLQKHFRQAHWKEQCPTCGLEVNKARMGYHKLRFHSDVSEFPYSCKTCNKGFSGKTKYNDHMNIHTGERPYSCRFCNLTFTDGPNCHKHMRTTHFAEWQQYQASKKV